jgi:hypothetical protein
MTKQGKMAFNCHHQSKPSAAGSEVSKMSMKSVFLAVGGPLPQLPGGENVVAFEDMREGEEKKDLVEGAVTDHPQYQCMCRQDNHAPLIPVGHHPLSRRTDPHPSPLSTCLMTLRCTAVAFWGMYVEEFLTVNVCPFLCSSIWDASS